MKRSSSEEARSPAPPSSDLHRDLRPTTNEPSSSRSSSAGRPEAVLKQLHEPHHRKRSAAAVLPGQVLLVVLSVWSSRQHELAANAPSSHLTALPVAQFAVLAVTVTGWSLWTGRRKRSPPPPAASAVAAVRASDSEGQGRTATAGAQRKRAWLAGAMAAVAATVRGLQATQDRPEQPRLTDALEVRLSSPALVSQHFADILVQVFAVPSLLAMMLVLRPRLLHPQNWGSLPSSRTVFTFVGLTFLLAFLLIGTPLRASNVGVSLAQSVLEAGVVLLAKDGLSGEGCAIPFLQHAGVVSAFLRQSDVIRDTNYLRDQ